MDDKRIIVKAVKDKKILITNFNTPVDAAQNTQFRKELVILPPKKIKPPLLHIPD